MYLNYVILEILYKTVGYKWRNITETENMMQIVFMNDKKVVCYLYGDQNETRANLNFDKSEYKDNVITIYPNDNDKFKVEKGEDIYTTYLEHIIK